MYQGKGFGDWLRGAAGASRREIQAAGRFERALAASELAEQDRELANLKRRGALLGARTRPAAAGRRSPAGSKAAELRANARNMLNIRSTSATPGTRLYAMLSSAATRAEQQADFLDGLRDSPPGPAPVEISAVCHYPVTPLGEG
jgi:hypothetical protein